MKSPQKKNKKMPQKAKTLVKKNKRLKVTITHRAASLSEKKRKRCDQQREVTRLPNIDLKKESLDKLLKLSLLKRMRDTHIKHWDEVSQLLPLSHFGTIEYLKVNNSIYKNLINHPRFINELLLSWLISLRVTPNDAELNLDNLVTLFHKENYGNFINALVKLLKERPDIEKNHAKEIEHQMKRVSNIIENTRYYNRPLSPSPTSVRTQTLSNIIEEEEVKRRHERLQF
jgi:hypothetical protein